MATHILRHGLGACGLALLVASVSTVSSAALVQARAAFLAAICGTGEKVGFATTPSAARRNASMRTVAVQSQDSGGACAPMSVTAVTIGQTERTASASGGQLLTSPYASNSTVSAGAVDAGQTTMSASPISIAADGSSTSTVTVQARDANANNETSGGATVTLSTIGRAPGRE